MIYNPALLNVGHDLNCQFIFHSNLPILFSCLHLRQRREHGLEKGRSIRWIDMNGLGTYRVLNYVIIPDPIITSLFIYCCVFSALYHNASQLESCGTLCYFWYLCMDSRPFDIMRESYDNITIFDL